MLEVIPKKSLGQNFLIDKNIRDKVIASCDLSGKDYVLEIGAGEGVLTSIIAAKVKSLVAVEIDQGLCHALKERLKEFKNTKIVCQDILRFNLKEHFKGQVKIKVIGNLPFYITTPILVGLISQRRHIRSIFVTVQKEVAQRFLAKPGTKDYSAFTCFLNFYTRPKILFEIRRNCFFPQPGVDSVFVRLDLKRSPVKVYSERLFFQVIRLAFNQRRKMLKKSLQGLIGKADLSNSGVNLNLRPEALKLEDFAALSNLLYKIKKYAKIS